MVSFGSRSPYESFWMLEVNIVTGTTAVWEPCIAVRIQYSVCTHTRRTQFRRCPAPHIRYYYYDTLSAPSARYRLVRISRAVACRRPLVFFFVCRWEKERKQEKLRTYIIYYIQVYTLTRCFLFFSFPLALNRLFIRNLHDTIFYILCFVLIYKRVYVYTRAYRFRRAYFHVALTLATTVNSGNIFIFAWHAKIVYAIALFEFCPRPSFTTTVIHPSFVASITFQLRSRRPRRNRRNKPHEFIIPRRARSLGSFANILHICIILYYCTHTHTYTHSAHAHISTRVSIHT